MKSLIKTKTIILSTLIFVQALALNSASALASTEEIIVESPDQNQSEQVLLCIDPDFRNIYRIEKNDGKIKAKLNNPKGSLSLDSDPLSSFRVSRIQHATDFVSVFKDLPEVIELNFEEKDCIQQTSLGEVNWSCVNRAPGTLGGFGYRNVGLTVYTQSVQSPFSNYQLVNVMLTFGKVISESESSVLIHNYTSTIAFENSDYLNTCNGSLLGPRLSF